jgi:hypothetical protein
LIFVVTEVAVTSGESVFDDCTTATGDSAATELVDRAIECVRGEAGGVDFELSTTGVAATDEAANEGA